MNRKIILIIDINAAFLAALIAVIMLTGYSIQARTMVYVSNADSREIYVLELEPKKGSLRLIEKVGVPGTVMPLAISPDRRFLYAGLRSEPFSVSSFAISPANGKLTLLKNTMLPDNMAYISTDRKGRFLFGASYSGNRISVNGIEPDGTVTADPLQIISTGKNAHCVLTDLSNKFLFASNLGNDRLMQFRFDEISGRLTPNVPSFVETKKGAGPRHFVFHSNRRTLFGINELDGTLNTYSLDASGKLKLLESTSVITGNSPAIKPWAADLHITPDGKFLYATERATSTITAYRVDGKNGKLTLIESYPTENQPRGFNISPKGDYLIVAGQKSNGLSVYRINNKNGMLRRVAQMEVGTNPNWIEVIEVSG